MNILHKGVLFTVQSIQVGEHFEIFNNYELTGKWTLHGSNHLNPKAFGIQIGEWDTKEEAEKIFREICIHNNVFEI